VRNAPDAADQTARDQRILSRMLADADALCASGDALLVGQYRHLRGRIAALIDITVPTGGTETAA
jgi:hypothetical protein